MKKLFITTLLIAGLMIVIPISAAKITAEKVGSKINVTIDNKFFTSYIFSDDEKYPFFYPVNGPFQEDLLLRCEMENILITVLCFSDAIW